MVQSVFKSEEGRQAIVACVREGHEPSERPVPASSTHRRDRAREDAPHRSGPRRRACPPLVARHGQQLRHLARGHPAVVAPLPRHRGRHPGRTRTQRRSTTHAGERRAGAMAREPARRARSARRPDRRDVARRVDGSPLRDSASRAGAGPVAHLGLGPGATQDVVPLRGVAADPARRLGTEEGQPHRLPRRRDPSRRRGVHDARGAPLPAAARAGSGVPR